MAKIAFLGAGSLGFGRRLVSDILSFPELAEGTIHLVDPSAERLGFIKTLSDRMVEAAGLSARIEASTDREEGLDGADYVIASIRVGEGIDFGVADIACGCRQQGRVQGAFGIARFVNRRHFRALPKGAQIVVGDPQPAVGLRLQQRMA